MATITIVEGTTHLRRQLLIDGAPEPLTGLDVAVQVFTRTGEDVPGLTVTLLDQGDSPGGVEISGIADLTPDESPYRARFTITEAGRVVFAPDSEAADRWIVVRVAA